MSQHKHLKEQFNTELSPDEEARMWSRVVAKRDASEALVHAATAEPDAPKASSEGSAAQTFGWRRAVPWGLSIAAAASLLFALRTRPQTHALSAGPLHAAASQLLAEEAIGSGRSDARDVAFDDGSHVQPGAGAHVAVLENSAKLLTLKQTAGNVRYAVTPGGPRRWSVECTLASIEVVGTEFIIEDSASALHVHVDHGVVLVRGELVPGRVQRLTAGEDLRLARPDAPVAPEPMELPNREGTSHLSSRVPMHEQAKSPPVVAEEVSPRSDADVAWDGIDALRGNGNAAATVQALASLRAKYPNDRRASLAAFLQARLLQDSLKQPAAALQCVDAALLLGLPADIRPDAIERQRQLRCALDLPSCEALE